MAMQQPGAVRLGPPPREDSGSSSRMESYLGDEPTFDSARGSSSSGASELQDLPPPADMVTVVWKKMSVAYPKGCMGSDNKRIILHWVSGFAEPRSVLAIVGPANAGKSALVCALGNRIFKPARMYGEILINGLPPKKSPIQPTFFEAADEPLTNVTVELALLYTAQLRVRSPHKGAVEAEVRRICQQLGLLNDLERLTNKLDAGLQRRLSVACQLVGAGPLLVLHDVLQGVHEGDALAIMRTIHEHAREGATAIVVCQQPTTDICSFFTRAFVLCTGEVVYFGETGSQAMQLLASSGMPCPPLYSPLEQFMRLIDPSFEVYLQVAQPGGGQDWNTRFSGMMFKVLQDAYVNSPVFSANQDQNVALMGRRLDSPSKPARAHPSGFKQFVTIGQRMVSQGLRCFSLFLVRIIVGALLSIIYAASYSDQGYTFTAATERGFIFMLVTGILPLLTLTSLPVYHNSWKVYKRERLTCGIGMLTQLSAMFTIIVPHVAVLAVLQAVIFVPWVNLNTTGSGWGYFILIVFLVNMLADILTLLVAATFLSLHSQTTIITIFMVAQLLGATFFAGTRRGIQVPLNAASYMAWGYRGLVNNEFADSDHTWTCTGELGAACRPLASSQVGAIVQTGFGGRTLWGFERWHAVWVLLAMYGFWAACLVALLTWHLVMRRSQKMHPALEPPEAKLQIMESANDMGGMPNGPKHHPPGMNGHAGNHLPNGNDQADTNGDSRV